MTPAALLIPLLALAPAEAPAPVAAPSQPDPAARPLVVRARGIDEDALRDALRRRSGGADVVLLRDAAEVDPEHTFVDIDLGDDRNLAISIILRDGRVFARRAPAPEGPRDVARLVAAMLAAIADEALAPLPERAVSPALEVQPPAPKPLPSEPEPAAPAVHASSSMSPRPAPSAPVPRAIPSPAPPPALALVLDGAPVVGLDPAPGLAGGAAGLALQLRGARPWLAAAALRVLADETPIFGLVRLRASLGAGAWLTRGRFDLHGLVALSVEPWLLTHEGKRVRLAGAPPAPLLGAHLRVAPSFALPGPFRIGAFVELAASAAPSGNAVRISLADQRLFVLGGAELSVGLQLHVRLGAPAPRDPERSPAAARPQVRSAGAE